jgi:DNA-binding NtrC family response regulator
VRELENVIETATVECPGDTIEPAHLVFGTTWGMEGPSAEVDLPFRVARQQAVATFERLYLLSQLRRFRGSIKKASLHAGITPKHVRSLMKRHGIERRDFRPAVRVRAPQVRKGSEYPPTG